MTTEPVQDAVGAEARAAWEEGLAAFAGWDLTRAHQAFERAHRKAPRDPRFMSWYGVTLVLVEKNSNLGIELCDRALRLAGPDPDLLLNQARVALALNQRERVVRAILRGLELFPEAPAFAAAREVVGVRRPPVIPFLSRNNPLNRVLGRIRHRWLARHAPPRQRSAVELGPPFAPGPDERRS